MDVGQVMEAFALTTTISIRRRASSHRRLRYRLWTFGSNDSAFACASISDEQLKINVNVNESVGAAVERKGVFSSEC
jgi:hypothetical protein